MNETMTRFGYPGTLVREYERWVVLLRPKQVTLGALVLVCKDAAHKFSDISPEAFQELGSVIDDIEAGLEKAFAYDKMNYLMLMMVDPDVHFHVVPRYEKAPRFADREFPDAGWPGPPALASVTPTDAAANAAILERLDAAWKEA